MNEIPSFPPGHRFGPYELIDLIGRGGFGEVYRARDVRLGREVAVKTCRSMSPEDFRRLEVEARATASLNHPNIIAIHDVGFDPPAVYIVTELLEGETLRHVVRGGPIPLPLALGYTAQILDALSAAHAKGIVHRDLKPDNVFVLKGGRLKVLDFGLAKFIPGRNATVSELETASVLTAPGDIIGTPAYLSPEQARGEAVDRRADLFAAGITLYEMLTGKPPFRAATLADAMSALLRDPPPPLPKAIAAPELDRVLQRCLAKEPDSRFQSADDFAFALGALAVPRRPVKRLPPWLIAAAAVAIVVALGGWRAGMWRWPLGDARSPVSAPAERSRETVVVAQPVDEALIESLFEGSSITRTDSTHVEVEAPAALLPSLVSMIQMSAALKSHRFRDEPALADRPGNVQLFRGVSDSKARISVTVSEVPIRSLLMLIAKSIGWPIIVDPSVRGMVTLSMTDVPWDLVVRSCFEFRGVDLTTSRVGEIWLISSRERAAKLNDRLAIWIPRSRRVSAAELARAFEPARSDSGLVVPNARLNGAVVVDRYDAFPNYASVLATIDGSRVESIQFPREGTRYSGKRVSMDFNEESVGDFAQRISKISGLNIVVEPLPPGAGTEFGGVFSGTLADVPWDNAFDVVMLVTLRIYEAAGRIVHVTPINRSLMDVIVETIALQRDDPAFFEPFRKYLTPQGALSIEPQTRTIVIREAEYRVRSLRRWIRTVDESR